MRGAIAAGHPLTAEVGARILERGGNAVDACVAAGFASWVAESPLTGPGGGGFMLVYTARDRRARVYDFFVTVPSGPREEPDEVTIVFEGSQTQTFRVGTGTCAVPGSPAGLEFAHRAHGTLPWRDLLVPAIELARDGVAVTRRAGRPARAPRARARPDAGRGPGRGRALHVAGARAHARAARPSRRGRALLGGSGSRDRALRAGDPARGPRALPRRPPAAGPGRLPQRRVRLEPAAVVRRNADRLRAAPPRAPRTFRKRRGGCAPRAGDGGADAGACETRHAAARGVRRHDAHQRRRRRGQRRLALGVDRRRRLGRRRPGHGGPHEQHARRARPDGRRAARRRAADEHDGPLTRARGRPCATRARERGLEPAAGRDHAGRRQRRRARAPRGRGDRRAAGPSRGRAAPRRAAARPRSRAVRARSLAPATTSSSAASPRSSGAATGRSPRQATRGAAAPASSSEGSTPPARLPIRERCACSQPSRSCSGSPSSTSEARCRS